MSGPLIGGYVVGFGVLGAAGWEGYQQRGIWITIPYVVLVVMFMFSAVAWARDEGNQ